MQDTPKNQTPQENTSTQGTPIGSLGEFGLINRIANTARLKNESSLKGIGDDAAVLNMGEQCTVVSTDLLMEGIHFDLMYTPLKHLGYKSVAVNISDIIAMNAQPTQVTVSLAISSRFPLEAIDEFYAGVRAACDNYQVDLIGGDTSSSIKGFFISVTALGVAKEEDIAYRHNAKVGDHICVTGDLGAAYLGLQLLEREKKIYLESPGVQPNLEGHDYLVGRQLRPEPRQDIQRLLKTLKVKPNAMIDISDGLASELLHICESAQVGCRIYDENIPLNQKTLEMAQTFGIDPLTCALSGGEDYELLFTVDNKYIEELETLHGISIIGRITEMSEGRKIYNKSGSSHDLIAQGWKHLSA